MHRTLIKFTTELIAPERASRMLEQDKFPNQRPLNNYAVDALVDEIKRGKLLTTILILCATKDKPNEYYVVDGQHRLWAVVLSGIPQHFRIVYEVVDDMQAMGEVYASIDCGTLRKMNHRIQALKGDDTSNEWITAIGSAALYAKHGFSAHDVVRAPWYRSPAVRLSEYEAWAFEADLLRESMMGSRGAIKALFKKIPSLAVFLVAARYCPDATRALANEIGDNAELKKYSPAWQYNVVLKERFDSHRTNWNEYTRLVGTIWNAHHQGVDIKQLRGREPDAHMILRGTPFTGKEKAPELPVPPWRGQERPTAVREAA